MQRANAFRLARLRAGLTQVEAARRAGIPQAYLIAVENGRTIKRKLAAVLGMPLRDEADDEPRSTGNTTNPENRREAE